MLQNCIGVFGLLLKKNLLLAVPFEVPVRGGVPPNDFELSYFANNRVLKLLKRNEQMNKLG